MQSASPYSDAPASVSSSDSVVPTTTLVAPTSSPTANDACSSATPANSPICNSSQQASSSRHSISNHQDELVASKSVISQPSHDVGISTIGLRTSDGHSTPIVKEFGINLDDANEMEEDEIDLENAEVYVPRTNATNNNSEALLTVSRGDPTTHLKRHSYKCTQRKVHIRQQQKLINLLPSDSTLGSPSSEFVSALHDGKFDPLKMREGIAYWIVMHEHTFSIIEEEGFNMMLKI
ncbi:hypothetical protein V6N11_034156 [Hibiscus sabdariffa]|uniref:Uncharacterized protein n=1 Tax=Hibiscus sabdariffa TaxID=183260 RepID=A0ABR2S2H5_9ROSI